MLTATDVSNAGFRLDAAAPILIETHHILCRNWMDRYVKEEPVQKKLNAKDGIPSLTDTSVPNVVSFHTKLQKSVLLYNVALVPFNIIELELGYVGLCPQASKLDGTRKCHGHFLPHFRMEFSRRMQEHRTQCQWWRTVLVTATV